MQNPSWNDFQTLKNGMITSVMSQNILSMKWWVWIGILETSEDFLANRIINEQRGVKKESNKCNVDLAFIWSHSILNF